jgi:hypothetical protein
MNDYEKNLKENYANMHEDMLLNLKTQSGQTAEAKILLDEELARRGITQEKIEENKKELAASNTNEINGLRGWLILVGIGLVFAPFRLIFTVIQTYAPIFKDGTWDMLTKIDSPNYTPYFQSLMIGEMLFNLCMLFASIYLVYLFSSKSKKFPKYFIAISTISIIAIPLDSFFVTLVFDDMKIFDEETSKDLFKSLIVFGIWVPYMLYSKRVKNTFIQ